MRIRRLLSKNDVAVERYVPPSMRAVASRPASAEPLAETPLSETGELGDAREPDGADSGSTAGTASVGENAARLREQAVQEGYEKGYDEGVQAGYQQGYETGAQETETQLTAAIEEQFNSLLSALKAGADSVAEEAQRLTDRFEGTFPHAVLLVAEAVVRHETQTNEAALKSLIQETLAQFPRATQVTVHLNPADYDRLAEQPSEVWNSERLSFASDGAVSLGGAIFATETSIVDARLETRLIEAARALLFPASDEP